MESQRTRIRRRIEASETFTADELIGEIGCTRPAVHQVISQMTEQGYVFDRQTLRGRRGAPILFRVRPPTKPVPTLEERISRIEKILTHHNLGTLVFTS